MSQGGRPSQRKRTGQHGAPPLTTQDITRAAALKRFRTETGMTQEALADRLGVSQGALSDWERAKKPLPEEVFLRLVQIGNEFAATQAEVIAGAPIPPGPGPEPGPEPAPNVDPPPASVDEPPQILSDLQAGLSMSMGEAQMAMVRDVQAIYMLIGQAAAKFVDQDVGAVIYGDSGPLAMSVVQAAEVSPLVARIVAMLAIGPVANMLIIHVLTAGKIVDVVRQKSALQRQANAEAAARAASTEPPAGAQDAFAAAQAA